jgi:ABC-type multidrug transport system ATPase subunit
MALMGPSGSGKTTLLNVLAQRATNASVQQFIYLNGSPTDLKLFRKLSSFVEQEDALVGSLTVRETLDFAARLALPRYTRPRSLISYHAGLTTISHAAPSPNLKELRESRSSSPRLA